MESTTVGWGIDRHFGGQLIHTVDGGRAWRNVTPPGVSFHVVINTTWDVNAPPPIGHNTVTWFQNGSIARTVTLLSKTANGSGRVLFSETTDGGQHWRQWTVSLPQLNVAFIFDPILTQLTFVNANDGWLVVGPGVSSAAGMEYLGMELWHTSDGGHTWVKVSQISGRTWITLDALSFNTASSGWLVESKVNQNPILLHTTNAGRTWRQVRLARLVPDSTPSFARARGLLVVSPANHLGRVEVLESGDAGQHWGPARPVPLPTSIFVGLKIATNNGEVLWDLTRHTLWRSMNGGLTWSVQSRSPVLTENPFLDGVSRHATWAWNATVGKPSTMARSINGGRTWMSWTPILVR